MKPMTEAPAREILAGLVERVTFHNAESGFCVLRVKARGHRDLVTIVGHAATIAAGEWITASGEWVNDRTHGQQFKARFMRTSAPTSVEGIEKYLASGMIRGIGPVYARKMVRAFGETVFDIIEAEPDRLREVDGIGPVRAERITAAWAEQKIVREIMVFLHSHGVGTARAVRIYQDLRRRRRPGHDRKPLPARARYPWHRLQDRRRHRQQARHREDRDDPGSRRHLLRADRGDGRRSLRPAQPRNSHGSRSRCWRSRRSLVQAALDLELAEGTVIARHALATCRACSLAASTGPSRSSPSGCGGWPTARCPGPRSTRRRRCRGSSSKTGLALAASQVAAIRLALVSKVLVITGGPGVGKTTIVNAILRILAAKGVSLLLCAPTGRAAKRMTEATGFEAKTIHRLLEVDPKTGGFKRNGEQPARLRPAGRRRDVDGRCPADAGAAEGGARPARRCSSSATSISSLRSGPGQVLADLIASGAVPVVRLTEVFRQAAQSRIITSAHRINQGSCRISPSPRATATSTSCRRTIPKPPCRGSSSS